MLEDAPMPSETVKANDVVEEHPVEVSPVSVTEFLSRLTLLLEGSAAASPPARDVALDIWWSRYHRAVSGVDAAPNRPVAIFETALEIVDARLQLPVSISAPTRRIEAWLLLVRELRQLREPARYIGSFRATIGTAFEHASALEESDRQIAALLVTQVAVANVSNIRDLQATIAAVRSYAPATLSPKTVVNAVLRPSLRVSDRHPRAVELGLRATLDVLARATKPVLDETACWALLEAFAAVGATDGMWAAIAELHPLDQRLIGDMFGPGPPGRSAAGTARGRFRRRPA